MPDFSWAPRSPLQGVLASGHSGAHTANAGISLTEIRDFSLVLVVARRGRWADVAAAAGARFGAPPPKAPLAIPARDATLIWSGPDQFLVLSKTREPVAEALKRVFSDAASLSDRSDAHVLIRVSGSSAQAMLAKVSSLDYHPAAFPHGAAAATSIDHTGVHVWRNPDAADGSPVLNLLVFSTFAESLWNTMLDASAEYGVAVRHAEAAASL